MANFTPASTVKVIEAAGDGDRTITCEVKMSRVDWEMVGEALRNSSGPIGDFGAQIREMVYRDRIASQHPAGS